MNRPDSVFLPTLIVGIAFLGGYLVGIFILLRLINKAEDKTARKHWGWAFLPGVISFIFFVTVYLFSTQPIAEKINNLSSTFICASPVLLINGLFYFTRRAPWFWKNRQIFPNDIINNGLLRRNKPKKIDE
jgi:hypothetical protein